MVDKNKKDDDVKDASDVESMDDEDPVVTKPDPNSSTAKTTAKDDSVVDSPKAPTGTIMIEHRMQNDNDNNNTRNNTRSGGLIASLLTPNRTMAIGLFGLVMTGGFVAMLTQWFEIPGLNDQIDNLEDQVDRLEEEVDRLEEENDRFEFLNDQLNSSVMELEEQNQILNESNTVFRELNDELNASVSELESQNQQLNESNAIFKELNSELEALNRNLSDQVADLSSTVVNLTETNEQLSDNIEQLNGQVEDLTQVNENLEEQVANLTVEVSTLESEVDRLQTLNDELLMIMSFLNDTSSDLGDTADEIAQAMAEILQADMEVRMGNTEQTYLQRTENWDCAFRDAFRDAPFMVDESTIPIGLDYYDNVTEYTSNRILNDICLSSDDLDSFLGELVFGTSEERPVDITAEDYISGTNIYLDGAMVYYFGGDGLTPQDWYDINWDCNALPEDKRFNRTLM